MEPVVFLTNWMMTAQSGFYYLKLRKHPDTSRSFKSWSYFFLLFAGSTFFGGLSHLLFHYLDLRGKIPGWSLAILSITFLELGVFQQSNRSHWNKGVGLQTLVIFILLILDFKFLWVTIQTVIGLVLVLGIVSFQELKKGERHWRGYLFGIGWMLLSVPVLMLQLDFSIWFNRHDISHLLMMLCLYQFYRTTLNMSTPTGN